MYIIDASRKGKASFEQEQSAIGEKMQDTTAFRRLTAKLNMFTSVRGCHRLVVLTFFSSGGI